MDVELGLSNPFHLRLIPFLHSFQVSQVSTKAPIVIIKQGPVGWLVNERFELVEIGRRLENECARRSEELFSYRTASSACGIFFTMDGVIGRNCSGQ